MCHYPRTQRSSQIHRPVGRALMLTTRPKYYVPRHPFQTAPYYPQSPHPALSTHAIFSQLDVETLFYVFYFLPGTYQQCVISPVVHESEAFNLFQVSCSQGAQAAVMAFSCQVSDLVPTSLGAAGHYGRIRTRRLCLL